jgi:hypothetical protein
MEKRFDEGQSALSESLFQRSTVFEQSFTDEVPPSATSLIWRFPSTYKELSEKTGMKPTLSTNLDFHATHPLHLG